MALESVSGADFGCVLHHLAGPDPFQGVSGPKFGRKLTTKLAKIVDFLTVLFLDLAHCQTVRRPEPR